MALSWGELHRQGEVLACDGRHGMLGRSKKSPLGKAPESFRRWAERQCAQCEENMSTHVRVVEACDRWCAEGQQSWRLWPREGVIKYSEQEQLGEERIYLAYATVHHGGELG